MTAPKPLLWRDSGRRLTLQEMFDADYLRTVDYVDAGIEVRALDESALLEVVKEAWWRSRDKWVDQSRDQRRLNDAWELLEEHPGYEKLHGERHPSARISSVWLRQLEDELSAGGTRRSG